jgi:hypothetical protein
MKLADARSAYDYFSGKASDIVRQLGFAGIAIIWVFKEEVGGEIQIPQLLLWAGLLIILTLAFDLVHYAAGTLVWGAFHRSKERAGVSEEVEFAAPAAINWPGLVFFWSKILCIALAYVLLGVFVARALLRPVGA